MQKDQTDRDDDGELAGRLGRGDLEALVEIFERNRPRLRRMVECRMDRRLARRIDPDDVLQEAFLVAEKRVDKFDAQFSPYVWLRMIVAQTLIDGHRHHVDAKARAVRREVSRASLATPDSSLISAQFVGDLTSPSQAAQRAELKQQIESTIDTMEPTDREILLLRHFEEASNAEVAEVLGISTKSVNIRYMRALRRLRDQLQQLPDFVHRQPRRGDRLP